MISFLLNRPVHATRLGVAGFLAMLLLAFNIVQAQNVNVVGALVGSGTYPTLGAAFTAINGGAQTGAIISITITGNTTEPGTATLNQNTWTYLTISPTGGAARTISGAVAGSLITFDGADRVGMDGLNTGGNSLTLENTSTASTASTVTFVNDARQVGMQRVSVKGSGAGLTTGVVVIGTGTVAGNDSLVFQTCDFGPSGASLPFNCVYAPGTATIGIENSSVQFLTCNFFDYFNAGGISMGINAPTGNSDWTVQTCKFYQTGSRTYTTAAIHRALSILGGGNNHLISGNTIGYASSAATGVYTMGGTIATRFIGIELGAGTTTASSIQGNTVTAISLTTSSGATTTTGILCGIAVVAGNVNVGTVTPNIIGATTGTGALTATTTTSGGAIVGIQSGSTGTVTIQNNSIGAFTCLGATPTIGGGIVGIMNSALGTLTVSGNTVGNATADNMRAGTLGVTTGSSNVTGISLLTHPFTYTVSGNTVTNLSSYGTGTGGSVRGITTLASTGTSNTGTISGNTISNLTSNNTNQLYSNGLGGLVGITLSAGTGSSVVGNTISNLRNINSTTTIGTVVMGIALANGTNLTARNNVIHSLGNASIGTTATTPPTVAGIVVRSGTTANFIYNNMISLGTGETSNTSFVGIMCNHGSTPDPANNIWHNTINIEGTAASGALPSFGIARTDWSATARSVSMNVLNNIVTNTRTGGTGQHFAIGNNFGAAASTTTGWGTNASNNNVLNANAATIGWWTGAQTFNGWRTASSSDASSFSGITVTYVSVPTNLHLNMGITPTSIESGGATVPTVTTDIDAQVRPGPAGSTLGGALAPDIGADEFDGAILDAQPPVITFTPLSFTCSTGDRTFTAVISDAISGVSTGATAPRVYYRKVPGVFFNSGGTLISGTTASGTWSFTISAATMGGLAIGDVIEYYIVAQDQWSPTNLTASPSAGFSGFNVNSVLSPPSTPHSYTIANTLSGTYTVGAAGVYPTLTAAVAAYNSNCLAGPVTFSLVDATYAAETYPITILSNADASAVNTLTIKPASGVSASFTGSSTTALLILSGADYVMVDGHNGTTVNSICPRVQASRNLTFTNTNTSPSSAVLSLQTTAGGNGATHNTIQNCNVAGSGSLATGVAINLSGPSVGTGTGTLSNDYNSIINNRITSAQVGVFSTSAGTPKNKRTTINLNDMDAAAPNAIGRFGVMVLNDDSTVVHANRIGNMSNSLSSDQVAIGLGTNTASNAVTTGSEVTNASVMYNEIDSLIHTATFSAVGIIMAATASGTTVVANNSINRVWANGTGGDYAGGIYWGGGAGSMQIYHNTINVTGPTLTSASQPNIGIAINGTTPVVDIRNNIIRVAGDNGFNGNTGIGTAYSSTVGAYANLTSNYNDIVVSGTGSSVGRTGGLATGTVRTSLLDWQTETGRDLNSVVLVPTFVSASDLHILPIPSAALSNLGTPLSISDDIDCDTRSATAPDMGADEWLPACVTAAVGAILPGDTSFCTTDSLLMLASTYSTGTGSTYVWESSPFGAGTWSPTGGTNPDGFNSGAVSTPTDYRLVVGCATDASSVISDVLTIFVGDSLEPGAVCQDISFALGVDGTGILDAVAMDGGSSDNCTASGSLVFTSSPDTVDCADIGVLPVTLTVTDAAGNSSTCISNVTIEAMPLAATTDPLLLINGHHVSCFGGSDGTATVAPEGGCPTYTYLWDNGDVTATATGLTAGIHTVIVTDGVGTADTFAVTLTEPATAVDGAATSTLESCVPGADATIDLTPSGGSPGYTYLWSDGPSTEDRTGLTAGSYTVTITDTTGCTFVLPVTVSSLPGPGTPTISMSGDTMFSSITDPSFTYQWLLGGTPVAGATDDSYYTTVDGSYVVVVTDTNGCTDTSTVFLMVAMGSSGISHSLSLWPNPASQEAFVQMAGSNGAFALRITDVYGKVVAMENAVRLDTPHALPLAGLSAGVYTVEAIQEGKRSVVRLVLQ